MATQHYDAVVIGAGQAGVPLATTLARAGRKTALVEREHVGGTCINEGCTPTKTMVASAKVAYFDRRSADYGVSNGQVAVDMIRVRQRKRNIVESFRSGGEKRLDDAGVELIRGEARFTGPRELEANLNGGETVQLTADNIFINVGARPANPPVEGLDSVPTLNSTTIMELDEVPDHLLVLGGSYVGLEFAQMFRRFGSEVTVVQRSGQLMGREDADVAEAVAEIMRQDGVEVLLGTKTLRADQEEVGGKLLLRVETSEGEKTLEGSHLLVAAGRPPNTEALNLEAAGVETDRRGQIEVNERLETSAKGVWALGDVKGGPAFTHISYDDFRILRTNLLESGSATIADRLVPYTMFMDPQLGRIGMSEQEARDQGRDVLIAKIPMTYVTRAVETGETRGFMKAVVDAGNDRILGCAVLGIEGGEIMAMIQIAMLGNLPYTALRDAVFAHPTLAEAMNTLFSNLERATA